MKKSTWRKHHKWFGLILAFFIIMFSLSGLILNHPSLFAPFSVSRAMLPSSYRYHNWNQGLIKGSIVWKKQVLLYGNNGIWLTNREASAFTAFNNGLPEGADNLQIRGLVVTRQGQLFALGQYALFQLHGNNTWHEVSLPNDEGDRLTDITVKADSMVITSRSNVYVSLPPYRHFNKITLPASQNNDGKVSLFRTIWLLHSGELFGTAGVMIVDAIAIILIFLSLSGIVYWFVPIITKRPGSRAMRMFSAWHNSIGKLTIALTLFLCITGWLLRPPALIAIASGKIPPVPFSTMDSRNAWHDKLRSLRYDNTADEWLMYSSDGFYTMKQLGDKPAAVAAQPPVSVMGINVEERDSDGTWLIGSFNGMYRWDRRNNRVTDYFTGQPARPAKGIPVTDNAIAGYSPHFGKGPIVINYGKGTTALPMPQRMEVLPMSLRNVCLEIHTGRMYTFLGGVTVLYICLMGIAVFWCLWTGWKIRYKR